MYRLVVNKVLADAEAAALAGTFLNSSHYHTLVKEDCDVVRRDGSPLLFYRRHAFTDVDTHAAWLGLRKAALKTRNRGMAAGPVKTPKENDPRVIVSEGGTRYKRILDDGTVSKTVEATEVESGIVGSFDRSARFPYCRQTAFTMAEPEKFEMALPLLERASELFRELLPVRWAAQMEQVEQTEPDWVIPGTCFTTVTVNRNWQTAVHQDAGDLRQGFGVMAAIRAGLYEGGFLCFPQWGVAVDMRSRGLVLADVHEWHGNTELIGRTEGWERISLVCYYRERMRDCGSAAEELATVKGRKRGDAIRGKR